MNTRAQSTFEHNLRLRQACTESKAVANVLETVLQFDAQEMEDLLTILVDEFSDNAKELESSFDAIGLVGHLEEAASILRARAGN